MKNLRLGIKLVGGFVTAAVIILAVGLLSISQQGQLNDRVKQLGNETFPAVQNVLIVKSELASIAGLMKCVQGVEPAFNLGRVPDGSNIVCTVTGNGLKDPDVAKEQCKGIIAAKAEKSAIMALIGKR